MLLLLPSITCSLSSGFYALIPFWFSSGFPLASVVFLRQHLLMYMFVFFFFSQPTSKSYSLHIFSSYSSSSLIVFISGLHYSLQRACYLISSFRLFILYTKYLFCVEHYSDAKDRTMYKVNRILCLYIKLKLSREFIDKKSKHQVRREL